MLSSAPTTVAIALVEFYQRRLSPLKGYSCAYRVLRGRCSCSEYGKRVLRRGGLPAFFRLIWRRFDRCARAAAHLRAAHADRPVLDYAESPASRRRRSELVATPAPAGKGAACDSSAFEPSCSVSWCLADLMGDLLCGALGCICSGS